MNGADDVMQVLGGLSEGDRNWILDRLTPSMREGLLSAGTKEAMEFDAKSHRDNGYGDSQRAAPPNSSATSSAAINNVEIVRTRHASQLLAVLEFEPAWITHALLSKPWPWRDEIQKAMTPIMTGEIRTLTAANVRYPTELVDAVVQRLAEALENCVLEKKQSQFQNLLASLTTKLGSNTTGGRS